VFGRVEKIFYGDKIALIYAEENRREVDIFDEK
jgi:hypothetical protein